MSTLTEHITIPKNVYTENDLDFQYLKKIGIEYIESMGGKLWTDFNSHDPGITILEMLCYAITDLGNRINMPIEDLLASENNTSLDTQFSTADKILTTRSVTSLDYRKLFIDLEGVRNCWMKFHKKNVYVNCKDNLLSYDETAFDDLLDQYKSEFVLKGLYDILVDFDISEEFESGSPEYLAKVKSISAEIRKVYHQNRNLCEDLIEIQAISTQPIAICASIELEKNAIEEKVHAEILFTIQAYFAPEVNFYSLKEMLDKGYRTDEVFDGPLLKNGFIDTEELIESELRSHIRLSDIMNLVSSIEGVKIIKELSIGLCDASETDEWLICLEPNIRPVLCDKSTFSYAKDVLPLVLNESDVDNYKQELKDALELKRLASSKNKTLNIPQGYYSQADWYTTIQNDFPDTYGIGENGLASTATEGRKAQAKQLKAYLLFFDQILASYFSQLGVVRDLLSSDKVLAQTYFTQAVKDIKDFDELVTDYSTSDNETLTHQLFDELDEVVARRNELLDHLIARFAEKFSEYTFIMKSIYGKASEELVVDAKQYFLSDYALVSQNRGGAFNYYQQDPTDLWDTPNVSGTERRVVRLGGFKRKDFWRRNLSDSPAEVYPFKNADDDDVYRWRIRDLGNKIVLSSTEDYPSIEDATREMYKAVYQLIQTSEAEVERKESFIDDEIIGNIEVKRSAAGNYSFNVINPSGKEKDFIIARHFKTHSTVDAFKKAVLQILRFFKHEFSEEGIYLVENILLRPDVTRSDIPSDQFHPIAVDDCTDCCCKDPYSFRVSIVLPGYTQRFANIEFRDFLENLIREELPSHIVPRICWIGYRNGEVDEDENDLMLFEKTFKEFLIQRSPYDQEHDPESLKKFIESLNNLNTIYPVGRLHDCDSNSSDGKIILGRTNIGSLK
jgi:uncharacterized protein